jgi:hypothetical protein
MNNSLLLVAIGGVMGVIITIASYTLLEKTAVASKDDVNHPLYVECNYLYEAFGAESEQYASRFE